jgi:hypothetical protein
MTVLDEDYRHPNQATRVRLVLYERPESFLLTEERLGSTKVVRTLGAVPTREAALALAEERRQELVSQRYARVGGASSGS